MIRPITLTTGQWADLSLEEICKTAEKMGYNGLEISIRNPVLDIQSLVNDAEYCKSVKAQLESYNLQCWALSSHAIGKCVADSYDPRLDIFVPEKFKGKPNEIRAWAVDSMMKVPSAAKNLGCSIVTSFMGSPIWKYFYSFPPTTQAMIDDGYGELAALWKPILDEFSRKGISFALEVHPSEIAFDYYSTERLIKELDGHSAFGLNFDPSHLLWQGIDPVEFIDRFELLIRHVHMKDVALKPNGKRGILGSHLPFGDRHRGWNFRSVGRGDINFEDILRTLDDIGYNGPLSVEWEDNGLDRIQGATESIAYIRKLQLESSDRAFDDSIHN